MADGLRPILLLYLSLILISTCICSLHAAGFKTDPRRQFYNHAVVHPKFLYKTNKNFILYSENLKHEENLTFEFVAFDRDYIVDLFMNKYLFPRHYFEKHHEDGSEKIHRPMKEQKNHCYYNGKVRNMEKSWAALSLCNGISGVIHDGKELFYIEPDELHHKDNSHLLFRSSDLIPNNLTCGTSDDDNSLFSLSKFKKNKRSVVLHEPYKSNSKSRFVELVIVNDNKEFIKFNRSKELIFARSKQIANIVNGLYSSLNIYVALVGVIIWSEHDEIKLSTDGDVTLTNFLYYRRERLALEHPNDNAQLITAITFDKGVVGKALKGPICTFDYSGGVNMDHSDLVGLVATTVAHELGHNFGMEHDSVNCKCPDSKCIMAPSSSSSSPNHWSSCSVEYLEQAYLKGMDYCLRNRPNEIIGATCGNSFLEEGEECDCGLPEFCDNFCCNATSCQLFSNASCATGECCDMKTCQIKKSSTMCRDTESECDLPEYCDGKSEFCPLDTHRQNGVDCGNRKAYCFEGNCNSHADQCKLLWGPSGKMSDSRCFDQNSKGNINGNCGYYRLNQTYKPCNKEDVLCGMLHCTHLNEKLEFGMKSASSLARSHVNVKGKVFTCHSAVIDLGYTDPGLVPSGAKCGKGKVCVNQKCIAVEAIRGQECFADCYGHGLCNDKGNCHCSKGYGTPHCDGSGPGGSIDSGPASDPGDNRMIEVAVYVIFLGFVPFVIISAAVVYYLRPHFKTWWITKARKAKIKCRAKQTAPRKPQPAPKFNIDPKNLRGLEISAPIQQIAPVLNPAPPVPHQGNTNPLRNPVCNQYSEINNRMRMPVSSGAPGSVLTRKPSCPTSTMVCGSRAQSSLLPDRRHSLTSRPSCPPPRPPPPRPPPQISEGSYSPYEKLVTPSVNEVEDASHSNYYDDCQTVEFLPQPGVRFHEGKASSHLIAAQNSSAATPKQSKSQMNNSKGFMSKPSPCYKDSFTKASLVASLAQKFENQDSIADKETDRSLLVKGFKQRPLPAIPGKPNV